MEAYQLKNQEEARFALEEAVAEMLKYGVREAVCCVAGAVADLADVCDDVDGIRHLSRAAQLLTQLAETL